jgi:hypothetical protein
MTARVVVDTLLETGPDEFNPRTVAAQYMETVDFDEGVDDITRDARELYQRLVKDGTISTLQGERRQSPFDNASIAQAILQRAIERRGSLGAKNAYRAMKRLNYYNF